MRELDGVLTGLESAPANVSESLLWVRKYRNTSSSANQSITFPALAVEDISFAGLTGDALWSLLTLNTTGVVSVSDCVNALFNSTGGSVGQYWHKSGTAKYEGATTGNASGSSHYLVSGGTAIIAGTFDNTTPTSYAVRLNLSIQDQYTPAVAHVFPAVGLGGNSSVADLQANDLSTIIYHGDLVADGVTWDAAANGTIIDNTGIVLGGVGIGIPSGSIRNTQIATFNTDISSISDTLVETAIEVFITPSPDSLGGKILVEVSFDLLIDNPNFVGTTSREARTIISRTTGTPVDLSDSEHGSILEIADPTDGNQQKISVCQKRSEDITASMIGVQQRYVLSLASGTTNLRATILGLTGKQALISVYEVSP